MKILNSKLFANILNIISVFALFFLLCKNIPFIFGKSFDAFVYNSDYFINYTSGFIKRGLDGHIIYMMTILTDFSPVNILRFIYLSFFIILLLIVLNVYLKTKIPFYFIFSPFLFIFSFVYFPLFHVAKDMEILIISYLVLYLFVNLKSRWLFNIVLSLGILVHEEIFIFIFLPLLLIYLFYLSEENFLKTIARFCVFLFPSTIVFLFMTLKFNGLSNNIQIIYDSWKPYSPYLQHVIFNSGLFDGKPRMIFATLKESYNLLGLIGLVIINFLFITFGIYLFERKHFIVIFLMSALQILPSIALCFIASDFGRWFYIPNVILLFSVFLLRDKTTVENNIFYLNDSIVKIYNKLALPAIGVLYIFGGMPYGGFNIYRYFYSNPLNIIINWANNY
ncbi:hypothetical protein SAMN05216273_11429 [Chryseobacterium taihuense]|uniref:EpsG family protein n=2 Tax=Chryseobacterium taihuense TaxID=1141221 RepID=A0ABY0QYU1_9FLAO|nr:hypothetical protein SAMN05216273_11429 [Chryseobacterium taihuense]